MTEARGRATVDSARAEAEAADFRAVALEKELTAKARGQQALNEAENVLREEIIELKSELARLQALPEILEQVVKPAEKIDSIRVHHISGDGFKNLTEGQKVEFTVSQGQKGLQAENVTVLP